jgi:hypothetical protein
VESFKETPWRGGAEQVKPSITKESAVEKPKRKKKSVDDEFSIATMETEENEKKKSLNTFSYA